jgi:hypothetical protein
VQQYHELAGRAARGGFADGAAQSRQHRGVDSLRVSDEA